MGNIRVENLQKSYGSHIIVRDFSLEMNSGEIVGLLGPNGAGKTTAFYMIVGLVPVSKGKIFLNDIDITSFPIHERARLGLSYLPQEASIFRKLSVADNILSILELRKDLNEEQRHDELEKLLAEFHIVQIRNSLGISLSGGERRRVEIARAIAINPKFILLDEPFAGIDPISVVDLKNLIRYLRDRNIGVLITDHNVRETLAICQRAYIINEGKILCAGKPEEVLHNQRVREVYLGNEFEL
jgi:lipopolysaccharide export system ATP-binding protein